MAQPISQYLRAMDAATRHRGNARLAIALALSLAVHGMVLSIGVRMPEANPAKDRGLEVVLVNARHRAPPPEADVLAQANLEGGGSSDDKLRPKSPLPPQESRADGNALVEARKRQPQDVERPKQNVITQRTSTAVVADERPVDETVQTPDVTSGLDLLDSAAAIARVEAQIDRTLEEYAQRPRKRIIGARAREYRFAQYVEDWRLKIERIGTLNYPEAARGKLYGSLLLSVTIRADGSVERVQVSRSSGHTLLDEAAVRIVNMAAPYAPFPPDIRKDTDMLEISRTWTFTNKDQVRAN
ncbi:energy transducer TonB [Azoarcus sp. L1K30]|nr:energy transducer TonB [Azoarcus sp. L1K30]